MDGNMLLTVAEYFISTHIISVHGFLLRVTFFLLLLLQSQLNKTACFNLQSLGLHIFSYACSGSFSKTTGKCETKWWASHLISIIHFHHGGQRGRQAAMIGDWGATAAVRRTCSVRWLCCVVSVEWS